MKEYMSKRKNSIDKRVRKIHRKAKAVGLLYLLGTVLLLATTMIFPVLKVGGVALGVTTFYQPLTKLLSGGDLAAMIASAMYALLLLVLLVNFIKSLGKLGWLTKRSYRYKNGYNRNMRAMSDMGKAFSSSFAAFVILHLQAYVLQAPSAVQFVAINAYITLGVGLFIHFVAGIPSGKVSRFYVGETGMVEEEKRTCGMFAYFFRNLIQIVATAAIVYGLAVNNQMYTVFDVVGGLMKGSFVLDSMIVLGLQLLTLIFLMVLIKHATAATEFNLFGIEGRGMLNFRVFSFFTFVTGAALTAWVFVATGAFNLGYAIVAGASFVAFLIDCIVKSRPKEADDALVEPTQAPMQNGAFPAPMQGKQNIYLQLPAQQMPMQQGVQQPVYVPVYYPYPQPQIQQVHTPVPMPMPVYYPHPTQQCAAMQAPADNAAMSFARPEPAPAPDYLKPTPSPEVAKEEGLDVKSKKELHQERKELSARKAELKREKEQSKRAAKMAKKNRKADAKTAKMAAEVAARREALNAAALGATAATAATLGVNAMQETPMQAPVETVVETPVQTVETPVEQKHFDGEVNELPATLNPKKDWRVRCPQCGKELNVKDTTPYHRCPACHKVFTLRKFETYTKKETPESK